MQCHGVPYEGFYVSEDASFYKRDSSNSFMHMATSQHYVQVRGNNLPKAHVIWESCTGEMVDTTTLFGFKDYSTSNYRLDNIAPCNTVSDLTDFYKERLHQGHPYLRF